MLNVTVASDFNSNWSVLFEEHVKPRTVYMVSFALSSATTSRLQSTYWSANSISSLVRLLKEAGSSEKVRTPASCTYSSGTIVSGQNHQALSRKKLTFQWDYCTACSLWQWVFLFSGKGFCGLVEMRPTEPLLRNEIKSDPRYWNQLKARYICENCLSNGFSKLFYCLEFFF